MARVTFTLMVALTLATWLAGTQLEQYQVRDVIAFENGFSTEGWFTRGDPRNVDITEAAIVMRRNINAKSFALYPVALDDQERHENRGQLTLRTSLNVETLTSPGIEDGTEAARIMLFMHEDLEQEALGAHTLFVLANETEETSFSKIVALDERTQGVQFVMINGDTDGEFAVDDARIEVVSTQKTFQWAALSLLGAWLLLGVLVFVLFAQRMGLARTLMVAIPLGAIAIGVATPELSHTTATGAWTSWLDSQTLEFIDFAQVFKLGHLAFFALAALALTMLRHRAQVTAIGVMVTLTILALASEGAQLFLLQRTPRLADLGLDLAGVAVGAAIGVAVSAVLGRVKRESPDTTPDVEL